MFFRDIIKRWLSYEKPVESWEAVAYLDDKFSVNGRAAEIETRSILLVNRSGARKVEYNYEGVSSYIRSPKGDISPMLAKHTTTMALKAWEQGGPLPANATPIKVSERKPAKLPPAIASDVNDRSK